MAKKQKAPPPEHWQDEPEEHDFVAAANYLSLLFSDGDATATVERLRKAPPMRREANDLLRASGLELLPETDPIVRKDMKKVAKGEPLSPVLLVRRRAAQPLIVADGYHRICASYHLDEDIEISCRMADAP